MNRRTRLLPIVLAIGAIAWFYCSSPTFISPETGRKSKVGLSESQEQTLGLQSFQQVPLALTNNRICLELRLGRQGRRAASSGSLMTAPEAFNENWPWRKAISKTRFVCRRRLSSTRHLTILPKMGLGLRRCWDMKS